jgi:hypothetical protein
VLLNPLGWAILLQSALAATVPSERAQIQACIRASTKGQDLRDQGKLLEARTEFRACAIEACPKAIRTDCARWALDVEKEVPSVVLVVREGGADVSGVAVSLDSAQVPLDGRPLEVNPGRHRVTAKKGNLLRELPVIVSTGEKDRLIVVAWSSKSTELPATTAPNPTPADSTAPVASPPPPVSRAPEVELPSSGTPASSAEQAPEPVDRRSLVGPAILAVTGLVGLTVFACVGAWGQSDLNTLSASACGQSRNCPPGATNGVRTKYVVADVGLGVGIAALAGAAVWYLAPGSLDRVSLVAPAFTSHSVAAEFQVRF